MKGEHEQPLSQCVMEVNGPDPETEIKDTQASEPFISSAKNTHLGRHVTLVPQTKAAATCGLRTHRGEIQG